MATATLPRMKLSDADVSLQAERVTLAEKARTILGYNGLLPASKPGASLLATLHSLGIAPLDALAVQRYKASKESTGLYSGTKICLLGWAVTISFLSFCIHFGVKNYIGTAVMFGAMTVFGIIISGAVCSEDWGRGKRTFRRWKAFSLKNSFVPEYVVMRAVQIKEVCPTVNFHVEQLTEGEEFNPPRLKDPFLVATLGDESYFIDVWDERDFKF